MWEALQHAASVCVLSKPIRFDCPEGKQFTRALPTPVCLVSFGADLAPSARHTVTTASFARMRTCDALFNNVTQMVLQCTGSACEIVGSRIDAGTLRTAASQHSCAILCPARLANNEVQKLVHAAQHVVFLSPTLKAHEHHYVEGSFLAFFVIAMGFFMQPIPVASPSQCSTIKAALHCGHN